VQHYVTMMLAQMELDLDLNIVDEEHMI